MAQRPGFLIGTVSQNANKRRDESEIGEGIDTGAPRISTPGVHAGLIAEAAEKSGGDPHVEVTSDGDVVVPEASVPKKKRGSKAKN